MISIIIPAYNCAKTIETTLKSILASGFSDYEIIIVDDGSNDETAFICKAFEKRHSRIRYCFQVNSGVSAARNRGLQEAAGEYIWFVDADDSIKEGSLHAVEEILLKQSPDMLVFGIEFVYSRKGRVYRTDELLPPLQGFATAADCSAMMYELFKSNSLSAIWSRIIKRSIILSMDTQLREDMFLYEDLEFVLRLHQYCSNVYFYKEVVYQYRQPEDEGNAARRLKRISHIPDLLSKIEAALADEADKDRILLKLYLVLAREKINASSADEINTICSDFHDWIDAHDLIHAIRNKAYPMMLYQGQIVKLIAKRAYSMLRHKAANLIKQTIGDFRKW